MGWPPPPSLLFPEAALPTVRLQSWSDAGRLVKLRGFTRHGLISLDHTTNADRSMAESTVRLPDLPVMLTAIPPSGALDRGCLYIRAQLEMAGYAVGRLFQGYLTAAKAITWPPGLHEGPTDGAGCLKIYKSSDPAAGIRPYLDVPTGARWELLFANCMLKTSVTVANRYMILEVTEGVSGEVIHYFTTPVAQAASLTYDYYWMRGHPSTGERPDGICVNGPLSSSLMLKEEGRVRIGALNRDLTADDFSALIIWVQEWLAV